jgi:hypothetical protein
MRTLVVCSSSAGVAQLVEHHLAKVAVESSSLFARSNLEKRPPNRGRFLDFGYRDLVWGEELEDCGPDREGRDCELTEAVTSKQQPRGGHLSLFGPRLAEVGRRTTQAMRLLHRL